MIKYFKKNFIFIILVLILFLPPFFDGGRNIFIIEVVLILIGILFFAHVKKRKKLGEIYLRDLNIHIHFLLLGLYLLFSFIGIFFSISPYNSTIFLIKLFGYITIFFIGFQIQFQKKELYFLGKLLLAVSSTLCLIGLYYYLLGNYSRLTSTFWWPNPFAGYLLLVFPISIFFFIKDSSKYKLCSGPLLILIFTSFILTGSRGAFLSIVTSIFFFFFLYIFINKNISCIFVFLRKYLLMFLSILFLSFILISVVSSIKNDNMAFVFRDKKEQKILDTSSDIRVNYWKSSWNIFMDYQIFGIGLGNFYNIYTQYQIDPISSGRYPHNWYLEILLEQGFFAFILFISFLVFVLLKLFQNRFNFFHEEKLFFVMNIGIVAFLIHNFFDINSHYPASMIIFWFFLGLLLQNGKFKSSDGEFKIDLYQIYYVFSIISYVIIVKSIIFFHSHYNFQKGQYFKTREEFGVAEKYYAKSVIINQDPNYLRQYGIILYTQALESKDNKNMKDYLDRALIISQRAIDLNSYNDLNYELRGRIYKKLGDSVKAEKDFIKAIKLNKFVPRHYINLSLLLVNNNEIEDALLVIEKILVFYKEEVVKNRELYILKNQETTSGVKKDIEYLKKLKLNLSNDII